MSLSPVVRDVVLKAQSFDRVWFIDELQKVGDLRALWLPKFGDTTTSTSFADPRTWTYDSSIAARVSHRGSGVLVSFNGSTQYATTPDTANMSFGDGTDDSPFSIVSLANVTNTAAARAFFSKTDSSTNQEYQWYVSSADGLILLLIDQSASVVAYREANGAVSMGSLHLFGCSYDGGGGATAANGMTLYEDAAVVASTANNNASYVAMEPLSADPAVASLPGQAAIFSGTQGFHAVFAEELSAAQHKQILVAVNAHFGLSL